MEKTKREAKEAMEGALTHSQELEELQSAARNALEIALMEQHLSDVVREVREITKEVRAGGNYGTRASGLSSDNCMYRTRFPDNCR